MVNRNNSYFAERIIKYSKQNHVFSTLKEHAHSSPVFNKLIGTTTSEKNNNRLKIILFPFIPASKTHTGKKKKKVF